MWYYVHPQAEVDRNIELLKKKDEELSEALEKMENQSENNDIDDVIIPTAPLYKQILNLYAEENAIEDTIFYLGEALRRGVIDLEVFLKVYLLLYFSFFFLKKFFFLLFLTFPVKVIFDLSPNGFVFVFSMCAYCPENSFSCERSCRKHGRLLDLVIFTDPVTTNTLSPNTPALIIRPRLSSNHFVACQWTFTSLSYFTSLRILDAVPA